MKKWLVIIALSMTVPCAPIKAEKKDTEQTTSKKSSEKKKRDAKKKAAAKKKREKEKKHTKSHHKRVKSHETSYSKGSVGSGDKPTGQTNAGRTIYEGPRGGHYYYTASGNKEYV